MMKLDYYLLAVSSLSPCVDQGEVATKYLPVLSVPPSLAADRRIRADGVTHGVGEEHHDTHGEVNLRRRRGRDLLPRRLSLSVSPSAAQ